MQKGEFLKKTRQVMLCMSYVINRSRDGSLICFKDKTRKRKSARLPFFRLVFKIIVKITDPGPVSRRVSKQIVGFHPTPALRSEAVNQEDYTWHSNHNCT